MTVLTLITLIAVGVGFALGYAVHTRYPRPRMQRCAEWSCSSRADPRCAAGNCTFHCQSAVGCNERCLNVWEDAVKRGEIPAPGADGRADLDLSFLKEPPK